MHVHIMFAYTPFNVRNRVWCVPSHPVVLTQETGDRHEPFGGKKIEPNRNELCEHNRSYRSELQLREHDSGKHARACIWRDPKALCARAFSTVDASERFRAQHTTKTALLNRPKSTERIPHWLARTSQRTKYMHGRHVATLNTGIRETRWREPNRSYGCLEYRCALGTARKVALARVSREIRPNVSDGPIRGAFGASRGGVDGCRRGPRSALPPRGVVGGPRSRPKRPRVRGPSRNYASRAPHSGRPSCFSRRAWLLFSPLIWAAIGRFGPFSVGDEGEPRGGVASCFRTRRLSPFGELRRFAGPNGCVSDVFAGGVGGKGARSSRAREGRRGWQRPWAGRNGDLVGVAGPAGN